MSRGSRTRTVRAIVLGAAITCGCGAWWSASTLGAAPKIAEKPAAAEASDQLEQYLQGQGLESLLAEQLAQKLSTTGRDDRGPLIMRLGKLYVQLLARAKTAEERAYWLERSHDLVKQAPDSLTFELRINLVRAQYAQSEESAERWRLALINEEEKAEVERSMRTHRQELERLAVELQRRTDIVEKSDNFGREASAVRDEVTDTRRLRAVALYYAGWAGYYESMLSGQATPASDALRSFGWILGRTNARAEGPSLEAAVKDRSFRREEMARAGLGVALCHSLLGSHADAVRWMDAIDAEPELSAGVRESLLTRRITILAGARRWDELLSAVERARKSEGSESTALPTLAARLLTVVALRTGGGTTPAGDERVARLAKIGMGDLVARQEIAQVIDLAQRFGTAPLGDSGFIVSYVRGVRLYEDALAAHKKTGRDPEQPTDDPSVANAYRQAAGMLDLSVREPDSTKFLNASSKAVTLAGRALFHAGDFGQAADRFIAAGKLCETARDLACAEESTWLAIVALDVGSRVLSGDAALWGTRADELTAIFLRTYPRSGRAAGLLLRRADAGGIKDEEAIAVLMGVPPDDPVYGAARRQISRLLYRVYRASGAGSRSFAASRFVGVGEEVLAMDQKIAVGPDKAAAKDATQRLSVTARQLLDALLSVTPPGAARAEGVLNALRGVLQFQGEVATGYEDELAFRRMQIALAGGDMAQAESLADRLQRWQDTPTEQGGSGRASRFASAAQRAMYVRAVEKLRAMAKTAPDAQPDANRVLAARDVVRFGERVIDQIGLAQAQPEGATISLWSSVASAAMEIYRGSSEEAMVRRSLDLDKLVLANAPASAESLRRVAEASEAVGEVSAALDAWRTLAGAYEAGTLAFFEAKYHTIRLTMKDDRTEAARVMIQHAVLYPEFGPSPWGSKLRELYEAMRRDIERVSAESARGAGTQNGAQR